MSLHSGNYEEWESKPKYVFGKRDTIFKFLERNHYPMQFSMTDVNYQVTNKVTHVYIPSWCRKFLMEFKGVLIWNQYLLPRDVRPQMKFPKLNANFTFENLLIYISLDDLDDKLLAVMRSVMKRRPEYLGNFQESFFWMIRHDLISMGMNPNEHFTGRSPFLEIMRIRVVLGIQYLRKSLSEKIRDRILTRKFAKIWLETSRIRKDLREHLLSCRLDTKKWPHDWPIAGKNHGSLNVYDYPWTISKKHC